MKIKPIIIILGLALIGMMPACTSEGDQPDFPHEGEVTEVDINLSFGSDWTIDIGETRAAPPGSGGNNDPDKKVDGDEDMTDVDEVRVLTFKRREGTDDYFYYDLNNDQTLPVEETIGGTDGAPAGHQHWTAHGKLRKTYGYEYRVIAIAYASKKANLYKDINRDKDSKFNMPDGEHNWFTISTHDQLKYEDVMASLEVALLEESSYAGTNRGVSQESWRDFIKYDGPSKDLIWDGTNYNGNINNLSRNVVQVPQLFYGILHSQTGSEIIGYSETDENGDLNKMLPLSGILYRGVAKVEIKLKLTKPTSGSTLYPMDYYSWIALVADEVTTDVNLSSYDGFLAPKKVGLRDNYTAVNYEALSKDDLGSEKTMTTWFLPTRTRLALRIKSDRDHARSIKNFQIVTTDPIYSNGNGTGIMSPDVIDGVFYLRRNHKYTIVIDVDKLMNSKYELN